MIIKIQQTKLSENSNSEYHSGWSILGNVSEVHQLNDISYEEYNKKLKEGNRPPGRVFSNENFPEGVILNHIFVHYDNGKAENIYFDGSAYLMNEKGETVESLHK